MNENTELTLVSNGDDWEGLYVNGVLVHEDHSIRLEDFATLLGFNLELVYVDQSWIERKGGLPNRLKEVR